MVTKLVGSIKGAPFNLKNLDFKRIQMGEIITRCILFFIEERAKDKAYNTVSNQLQCQCWERER
ncbi:hypothetical protein BAVI_02479 [Neobacillus vireti LMG 21834]|uniref:Uncharacterized protein n=1 Tax=Neobacillus vireti LMG 21834 TaxID=1131730 RepID=A0AB94ITK9_9BACI|nr:hypothetical protein BAVI_02479 [Neobacillus vireti LMG 21834]KLT17786.1 hypothetical protein AA980_11860 [Neobacillus vireti]